jgi:hypothetical protein
MRNLILLLCLALSGCATSYQPEGFTGGYSDFKFQDGVFRVGFEGNGFTGRNRAADFALLRSAEVALENGYSHFIILDNESRIEQSSYTTPTTSHTQGSAHTTGNFTSYSGNTTYSGGQTYNISKPGTTLTIKCFKDKPQDSSVFLYDAAQLKSNLRQRYAIKQ